MAIINKYAPSGLFVALYLLTLTKLTAQPLQQKQGYTRQDTLRGSITAERAWWDVKKYKLYVHPDFSEKFIRGEVTIVYKTVTGKSVTSLMQIDLQEPMEITAVFNETKDGGRKLIKKSLEFRREGNVYYIRNAPHGNKTDSITIQFAGNPRVAINPPWDGGWIFTKDAKGRPWMTVACQGLGASVWYPCKDHQSDEPDEGALIQIKTTNDLIGVANGKLVGKKKMANGIVWAWLVKNPINNYNIVPYIGKYVRWNDSYLGETNKILPLDYWVIDYNLAKSKKQFGRDVKPMLKSFEYWFGPYPFYDDGFKLVETPHLGMEHQSGIAYGNHYMDGYLGMDLSGTGWGKKWDYIIIHESGHEWFANNITTNDIADMWVHEGFTMYSEVLFIESLYGKQAANEYCQGLRKSIENDKPLIGPYGVNQEGSGDMYNKGANLIHTIRQLIDDDVTFRKILRGLNADFGKETIDSRDVEEYISKHAKKDFTKIFDQYLRTIRIPELEWSVSGDKLAYRWINVVEGFNMPVKLINREWLKPTTEWQFTSLMPGLKAGFKLDTNFYISSKEVKPRKSDF